MPDDPRKINLDLKQYFDGMQLDAEAVKSTLGTPYANVSSAAILDATAKVLKLSRREVEGDDRDSLEFQTVHDAADFMQDKVRFDQNGVLKKIMWKITNKPENMAKIPAGVLDRHVDNLFNVSGLSQVTEGINPIELYDQNQRVTRMGEGALPSIDAVPAEARNVNASFAGIVDPVRSPEGEKVGVDVRFARNVRKGPNNLVYTQVIDAKTNKPV
jgi:DNA-directed RNA polymerase beta subunit